MRDLYKLANTIKVSYPGIFMTDDCTGNILVQIPDLGCMAEGDTIEEAFADAKAAIEEYMRHGVLPYASTLAEIDDMVKEGDLVMYIDAIA
ncbi:MAG: type II toxin-antitoxin system HicB family antitoxin [Clostridia bacterium]|nr:type II toxin-antitoxin system HicB family antitoxin [Clostridia bacterium]